MRTYLKPLLVGFVGAIAGIVLVLLVYGAYLTYIRAQAGQAAFDFLNRQIQAQQQAAKPPSPVKPGTP